MGIGIVKTKKGKVSGIELEGYTLFKGIPYAKPPIGDLRFKEPVEMDSWDGVYKADDFKAASMQPLGKPGQFYYKEFDSLGKYYTGVGEDSLYLNIWTPAESKDEKLPVAFWIYGGAFFTGNGHEIEFDGEEYCKRGVILVTFNYRLGVFGFLSHPWLKEENPKNIAGNYGIFDQIAALKWVYENIEEFGGDPNKITVMGQSAGCMSTQTLVSTELTGNMIQGAIFQSGGGYHCGMTRKYTVEDAFKTGERFVDSCNVKSLEELRKLPAEVIRDKAEIIIEEAMNNHTGVGFIPVFDDYLIRDGYDKLVDKGKIKNIPYMLGTTKNDMFITKEMIESGKHSMLYNACKNWSIKCEELFNRPGYVYYFMRDLPGDDAGAFHSSELWYMFGTLGRCWRPMEKRDFELSKRMVDYWCNFIKYGKPNGNNIGEWKPCSKEEPFVMELI